MSRASCSICGSVASASAIRRGSSISAVHQLALRRPRTTRRAPRPAAIASAASTVSWQVNALVEATPISGPASVGSTASLSRAIVEVGTLTTDSDVLPLRLGVAQRRQRVGGLARLRDEDRQIALAQRRLAIAEFGGDIDLDRQPREALEPVFARHSPA